MCGRYLFDYDFDELYRKFILHEPAANEIRRCEVLPTDAAPVIVSLDGIRMLKFMNWGLAGYQKNQRLINARSETLLLKNRFSKLMDRQRCIVPATAFYEWEKQGSQKIRHTFEIGGIISFAGLYESSELGDTFTIITMEAMGDIAKIHGRMPVALTDDALAQWLDTATHAADAYQELVQQQPQYSLLDQTTQFSFF